MKYLLNGEETRRLSFRLLHKNDFKDWLKLFEAEEVAHFIGFGDIKTPEKQCQRWFEKIMSRYQNDLGGMNVLIDKNTGKMVGQCGLLIQEVDDIEELEIGYSVLPEYWGMGYATEAAIKCKEEAFKRNFSKSLISIVHTENIRSEKVARKNGMTIEKRTVFHKMPVNIFRITKREYEQQGKL